MKGDAVFVVPEATFSTLKTEMWGASSVDAVPPGILDWLVRARLLYGVPFEYLVPDVSLLPPESIRFFYVDRNWTDALVDGALSVGKSTSWEHLHHEQRSVLLREELDKHGPSVRKNARKGKSGRKWADASKETEITGFILRSTLVSAFPGMEILGYIASDSANPMEPLRIDRPAPDLMIALFPGRAERVVLREPSEGIVAGLDDNYSAFVRPAKPTNELASGSSVGVGHADGRLKLQEFLSSLVVSAAPDDQVPAALAAALLLAPTDLSFELAVPGAVLPADDQPPPGATVTPNDTTVYVPMQVDAFVDDGTALLTDLASGALPFAPAPARAVPRVLVRWALPDALTRAEALTEDGMQMRYGPIPDRWCIYRYWPKQPGAKLSVRAWVIDARAAHTTDLAAWNATQTNPGNDVVRLTAFGVGNKVGRRRVTVDDEDADPYFAVCFERARGRLNFIDDEWTDPGEIGSASRVSYVVVGWFADRSDDPLDELDEPCALRDKLLDLAWKPRTHLSVAGGIGAFSPAALKASLESQGIPTDVVAQTATEQHWRTLVHGAVCNVVVRPKEDQAKVAAGYPKRSLLAFEPPLPKPNARFATRPGTGITTFLDGKLSLEAVKRYQRERLRDAWLGRYDSQDDADARLHAEELVPLGDGNTTTVKVEVAKAPPERTAALRFSENGTFVKPPRKFETEIIEVERTAPRYWKPRPAVLSVFNCRRSYAHGFDGRLLGGFLEVRTPEDLIHQRTIKYGLGATNAWVVTGAQILDAIDEPREAPAGVRALCEETALLDEIAADAVATVVAAASGYKVDEIRKAVLGDQRLQWFAGRPRVDLDDQLVVGKAGLDRRPPSRIGVREWQQAWIPVAVDWKLDVVAEDRAWSLGAFDYQAKPAFVAELVAGVGPTPTSVSDRSMLTEGALGTIAARLAQDARDASHVEVANAAVAADFGTVTLPLRPAGFFAGAFTPLAVNVVDAFGQVRPVAAADMSIAADDQLEAATAANWFALPPRFTEWARIGFRLIDASDDSREATSEGGAVCGYLLPDHLDDALELYSADGENIGQLRSRETESKIKETLWEKPPMTQTAVGALPECGNRHVQAFARKLLAFPQDKDETALSALLRTADATLWTVDPIGRGAAEHLALVVGRPIALLRARVRLEAKEEFVRDDVAAHVRIGVTTRQDDGVIGYFVGDDYTRFYSLHKELAANAIGFGKGRGPLGIGPRPEFTKPPPIEPVKHQYIAPEDSFTLMPGQTRFVTILVDPRASIHVTTGAFPRKGAEIPETILRGLLDKLAVTFQMGPLLSDPEVIRMPLPAEIAGRWSWVHRVDPANWQTDTIENPRMGPRLDPRPVRIVEGWLRLEPEEPT